jgi:DHA2 family multidrug resistance protein
MFQLSGLNLYAGFWDICWVQVLQGIALSFLFIPLMALAMARIPPQKMGNATSIFNLMRNIGGSVGIAIMTTFLARRTQLHQNHLIANVRAGDVTTWRYLAGLRAHFHAVGADNVTASRKALGAVYGLLQQHAAMLAFVEAFWLMGVVFLLMLPFLSLLQYSKRPKPETPREVNRVAFPGGEEPEAGTLPEEAREEEGHLLLH